MGVMQGDEHHGKASVPQGIAQGVKHLVKPRALLGVGGLWRGPWLAAQAG